MDLLCLDDVAGLRIQSAKEHVQAIHVMNSRRIQGCWRNESLDVRQSPAAA